MNPESSTGTAPEPNGSVDHAAVREQLDRLLASELFKHSRRYPSFLRFIVESTLDGSHDELKERTIGVEVFGRTADYDTAGDPIVRNTASEVRKRLAQYYGREEHRQEIVIVLPVGAYVPGFRESTTFLPEVETIVEAPPPAPAVIEEPPEKRSWAIPVLAALAIAAGLLWVWTYLQQPPVLDRFWQPVVGDGSTAIICVAPPTKEQAAKSVSAGKSAVPTIFDIHTAPSESVSIFDARTAARVMALLQTKNRVAELRQDFSTSLDDLRRGPIVLVGGVNNDWSVRLTKDLRFSFEKEGSVHWIRDRENPTNKDWKIDFSAPDETLGQDFAVITRVMDSSTGRPMLALGGLARYGTVAAGEFATTPALIAAIDAVGPKGWEKKNVQVVLGLTVVNDNAGQPRVLATHFWD